MSKDLFSLTMGVPPAILGVSLRIASAGKDDLSDDQMRMLSGSPHVFKKNREQVIDLSRRLREMMG